MTNKLLSRARMLTVSNTEVHKFPLLPQSVLNVLKVVVRTYRVEEKRPRFLGITTSELFNQQFGAFKSCGRSNPLVCGLPF